MVERPKIKSRTRSLFADIRSVWRVGGFRGVARKFGWKVFAVFFFYYLIRDLTIYVLVPSLVAKGLFF